MSGQEPDAGRGGAHDRERDAAGEPGRARASGAGGDTDERLTTLEWKLMEAERTVETLDAEVLRLARDIESLRAERARLEARIESLAEGMADAPSPDDEKPPHY